MPGITTVAGPLDVGHGVRKYTINWRSDAAGAVSGNKFAVIRGYLLQIKFTPGTVDVPTTLYDATFVDTDSLDYISANGSDLSATASKLIMFDPPIYHDGEQEFDLVIASAGDKKTGTVRLYVRV